MRRTALTILLFFIVLVCFPADTGGQHRSFSSAKTTEFLQDSYYSYDDNPSVESDSWLQRLIQRMFRNVSENVNISMPNEIILYIVGALILFLILRNSRFSWKQLLNRGDKRIASAGEIRMDTNETDFLALARASEADKNFGLAVHFRFLHMMNLLSYAGIISIEENKTNWEYVRMIKDGALKKGFLSIVSEYDRIWYGEYQISEQGYRSMIMRFGEMDRMLG